jgi:hypothetical protein
MWLYLVWMEWVERIMLTCDDRIHAPIRVVVRVYCCAAG